MLSRFLIDFALKMASNLPCIIPKSIDCSGILVYDYSKLFNKEEISKGSFGSVYSAEIPSADGTKQSEKVVIKKLLSQDMEDKKQFIKEARILQNLKHGNIVSFKGDLQCSICTGDGICLL